MTTNRYPWDPNTTPNAADQDDPRYETPGGAQAKADNAQEAAEEYTNGYVNQTANFADDSVTRPKIAPGAVGATELDPSLLDYTTDIAVAAKFAQVDAQLAETVKKDVNNFGADRTGVLDSTAAFQAVVDSMPSEGGIVYAPAGTYIVNYLQTGAKSLSIIGDGEQVTVIKRNQNVRIIQSEGSGTNNLEIRDITFDGAGYASAGIRSGNTNRLRMIDVTVKNCGTVSPAGGAERGSIDGVFCVNVQYGVFVRVTCNNNERDGILGYPVVHLLVSDSKFEGNGRFASANQQDDGLLHGPLTSAFINNRAYDCKSGGFDAETHSSMPPCYSKYDKNEIIDCGNDDVGYSWGIAMGVNSYGEVTGNFISGLGLLSSNTQYRSGIIATTNKGTLLISDNRVVNCGRHGIFVESPGNETTIVSNTVLGNNECGIFAYNAPDVKISKNTAKLNKQHGIRLNLSSRAYVEGNVIKDNSQSGSNLYSGIRSELSFNLSILNNNVSGTLHKYCFDLDDEAYTTTLNLIGNQFKDAVTRWFTFAGSSSHGDVFNGSKVYYAPFTGAPGSGTWRAGDKIYITVPTAGGYTGFICITTGTPGTWKGFGTIQA